MGGDPQNTLILHFLPFLLPNFWVWDNFSTKHGGKSLKINKNREYEIEDLQIVFVFGK